MVPAEAKHITKKAGMYALTGIIVGLLFSPAEGAYLIPLFGYAFWSWYHGSQIAKPIIDFLYKFGPVHLVTQNISSLFYNAFLLNVLRILLVFYIGLVVGVVGGAIIRQIYLILIINHRL